MIRPAAWLLALASFCLAPALRADTLLDNIQGTTIGPDGSLSHFTGLMIDRDGRISAVLGAKDKRPKKPDYLIDGKGRFVMPGMIATRARLMARALALIVPESAQGDTAALPPPRAEDRDVAFGKMQRLLAAQGITAVADMGTTIEDWQTYRRAGDNGTLYIRIMAYAADIPAMALIAGPRPTPWLYDDRLRLNGLHMALPAGPASAMEDTRLRNILSRAAMDGFQLAVSVPDEAALQSARDAYEELAATYKGERRWRIEQGAATSLFTPGDADPAPARTGPAQIIASRTAEPASAGFADRLFGRLAVGERADFIVLDSDPLLASDPAAGRVLESWVGGRKIHDAARSAQALQGPGQSLSVSTLPDPAPVSPPVPDPETDHSGPVSR